MPEPTALAEAPAAGPIDDALGSALEAILDDGGRSRDSGAAMQDATVGDAQPETTAPEGKPAEESAPEPEGGDEQPDTQTPSRRGAFKELQQAREERDALAKERDQIRQERDDLAGRVGVSDANLDVVRGEVLGFLGLEKGRDGTPSTYEQLHAQATSSDGIQYTEDQRAYAELNQRNAMAGKLFELARRVDLQAIHNDLLDPDLGFDDATVTGFKTVAAYRQAYREAVEKAVRAEVDGKLEEQKAAYEAKLARASGGSRTPIPANGRPAPAARYASATAGRNEDPMSLLAEGLQEMEHARERE